IPDAPRPPGASHAEPFAGSFDDAERQSRSHAPAWECRSTLRVCRASPLLAASLPFGVGEEAHYVFRGKAWGENRMTQSVGEGIPTQERGNEVERVSRGGENR